MKYIFLTLGTFRDLSRSIFEHRGPAGTRLVPYMSDCMFAPFERHLASPRSVEMFLVHHTISVGDLATLTQLARRLTIVPGWYPAGTIGVHTVGFATPKALTQVCETFQVHPMASLNSPGGSQSSICPQTSVSKQYNHFLKFDFRPYPSDCEVVL